MSLDIRIGGHSYRPVLAGPPKLSDQTNAVCRTLDLSFIDTVDLGDLLGKEVELWYHGTRWYHGFIQRRGISARGEIGLIAYDGLFFLKATTDDFYIKNMTANQTILTLAKAAGLPVAALANTKVVFTALWYPGKAADAVAADVLARTYQSSGKTYLLRWDADALGVSLLEQTMPKEAWTFLAGVNLTDATYEESVEDMYNAVKLVNRETGKVVTKVDAESVTLYRKRQHFEEVDKDLAKTMDKIADQKLKELSKVAVNMNITGVNPNRRMPQLFKGDVVYVEEKTTGIIGAYYVTNVEQTFVSDQLVEIAADIAHAPEIPTIQSEDANQKPDFLKTKAEKEAEKKKTEKKKKVKRVVDKKKDDKSKPIDKPKTTTTNPTKK